MHAETPVCAGELPMEAAPLLAASMRTPSPAAASISGKLKPSNSTVPLAEPGASGGMDQCKLPSSSSLLWEGDKPLLLPTEYKWVYKPSAFPILCIPAALLGL